MWKQLQTRFADARSLKENAHLWTKHENVLSDKQAAPRRQQSNAGIPAVSKKQKPEAGKSGKGSKGTGKICKFFAEGRCKFGDSCMSKHECGLQLKGGRTCTRSHAPQDHDKKSHGQVLFGRNNRK